MIVPGPDELARFQALGPVVLARRGPRYFRMHELWCAHMVLAGVIPIAGWLIFAWSAPQMVLFLVAWLWSRNIGDLIRYASADGKVQQAWALVDEENFVDGWADVMRGARKTKPASEGGYPSLLLLIVGIACSVVATVLLIGGAMRAGLSLSLSAASLTLVAAIAAMFIEEVVSAVRGMRATPYEDVLPHELLPAAGPRGLGMLLLTFFGLGAAGGTLSSPLLIAGFNAMLIILGAIGFAGLALTRKTTDWLREHFREESARVY